jgi:hypothetical protein
MLQNVFETTPKFVCYESQLNLRNLVLKYFYLQTDSLGLEKVKESGRAGRD